MVAIRNLGIKLGGFFPEGINSGEAQWKGFFAVGKLFALGFMLRIAVGLEAIVAATDMTGVQIFVTVSFVAELAMDLHAVYPL